MKKINFINGKAPAINGTNLNQLQTNVENAIAPNLVTLGISEEKKISSYIWEDFVLDDVITAIGDKLSVNDGKITIGSGVSVIEVSVSIGCMRNADVSNGVRLMKNSNDVAFAFSTSSSNNTQTAVTIPNIYIDVQEGDVLNLQIINPMTLQNKRCFFSVRVIG